MCKIMITNNLILFRDLSDQFVHNFFIKVFLIIQILIENLYAKVYNIIDRMP